MKHVGDVCARELRSLFVSPVAYVVLAMWSVLGSFFFLSAVLSFQAELIQMQQFQALQAMAEINLNDHLISPFIGSMWIILVFAIPGISMGLFAAEKQNGTQELLMTSPLTIWDIVLGKYLAGGVFVLLLMAIVAFFPALMFLYGDPEIGKTAASLLGLLLVSLTYMAVGAFASSVTRNYLIAFFLAFGILLALLMLPFIVELGAAGDAMSSAGTLAEVMRWISTGDHFERLLQGLVDTSDLVYFGVAIGTFLVLAKTAVESVRWR